MTRRERSPRHALNEWRRQRAWALHREGWTGAAIAAALDVTPGAVSQWLKKARAGGAAALAGVEVRERIPRTQQLHDLLDGQGRLVAPGLADVDHQRQVQLIGQD